MNGKTNASTELWQSRRLIVNEDSISIAGTYATSECINLNYGVKVGYMYNGDILISTQGGTSTGYETHYYTASLPSGATLTQAHNTSSSYIGGAAGQIYACVISGITSPCTLSVSASSRNSTYDYVMIGLTLTEV